MLRVKRDSHFDEALLSGNWISALDAVSKADELTFDVMALSLGQIGKLSGYTRARIHQLAVKGWIPFKPIKQPPAAQYCYTDTPEIRAWCESLLRPKPTEKVKTGSGYWPPFATRTPPFNQKRLASEMGEVDAALVFTKWYLAQSRKAHDEVPISEWCAEAQDWNIENVTAIGEAIGAWEVNRETKTIQLTEWGAKSWKETDGQSYDRCVTPRQQ